MKVLAITSGRTTPSARFRFRQYFPHLASLGVDVEEACPALNNGARLPGPLGAIRARYLLPFAIAQTLVNTILRLPALSRQFALDLSWVERNIVPGADFLAFLLRRPYVLDLDDAVWLYTPFGEKMTRMLVGRAAGVIAGNATIEDWCSRFNSNVVRIPTAIDCSRFVPGQGEAGNGLVLGWTGTSVNFEHLRMIEEPLSQFLSEEPSARLRVVAESRPAFGTIPDERVEFVRWNPDVEAEAVATMDIGIMPLIDTPVSRAKCSFKMLQYMACEKPVIVSPVGLNAEILSMGELGFGPSSTADWLSSMRLLAADPLLRRRLGETGRRVALERFDTKAVAAQIASFLKDCSRL